MTTSNKLTLKPCPFCGHEVDLEEPDTLYPSGTVWRYRGDYKTYHTWAERKEGDEVCWSMNCPTTAGGCGAEITGDSREETIAAWEHRQSNCSEN